MIKTIEGNKITLDFTDEVEGIPICETTVKKAELAEGYTRVFEKDMRRFYAEMFPEPVIEPMDMEEMM